MTLLVTVLSSLAEYSMMPCTKLSLTVLLMMVLPLEDPIAMPQWLFKALLSDTVQWLRLHSHIPAALFVAPVTVNPVMLTPSA